LRKPVFFDLLLDDLALLGLLLIIQCSISLLHRHQ
jgi:hypothetical protein